jgi:hypothetical protein
MIRELRDQLVVVRSAAGIKPELTAAELRS